MNMYTVSALSIFVGISGCTSENGAQVGLIDSVDSESLTPGEVSSMNQHEISIAIPKFEQQTVMLRAESGSKTSIGLVLGLENDSFTRGSEHFSTVSGGCINFWLDTALNHSQTEYVFTSQEQVGYLVECDVDATIQYSQPKYDSQNLYLGQSISVPAKTWLSIEASVPLSNLAVQIDAGHTSLAIRHND